MHSDREKISEASSTVCGSDNLKNIFYKSEGTLPFKADIDPEDSYIFGGADVDDIAVENGLKFKIDWLKGQKTGFFIDQRENRTLLEKYSHRRNVLNMFSYTGGFSVYALRGDAAIVDSVDNESKTMQITDQNVQLNFSDEPRSTRYTQDAYKILNVIAYVR